jgi:hypothetical protein
MKILAGLLGGLILGILGSLLISVTFAASSERSGAFGSVGFFACWGIGILIGLDAKSAVKAWRKLLIIAAVMSFLLPLSGLIYTGNFLAKHVDPTAQHAGAQTAGAVIGGGLVSGCLGFVGFFLGIIFLVIGLLVGREKQVVYIQTPPPPSTPKSDIT